MEDIWFRIRIDVRATAARAKRLAAIQPVNATLQLQECVCRLDRIHALSTIAEIARPARCQLGQRDSQRPEHRSKPVCNPPFLTRVETRSLLAHCLLVLHSRRDASEHHAGTFIAVCPRHASPTDTPTLSSQTPHPSKPARVRYVKIPGETREER